MDTWMRGCRCQIWDSDGEMWVASVSLKEKEVATREIRESVLRAWSTLFTPRETPVYVKKLWNCYKTSIYIFKIAILFCRQTLFRKTNTQSSFFNHLIPTNRGKNFIKKKKTFLTDFFGFKNFRNNLLWLLTITAYITIRPTRRTAGYCQSSFADAAAGGCWVAVDADGNERTARDTAVEPAYR